MSPLNREPLMGPRMPPAGLRPLPLPRYNNRPGNRLGMPMRMPPPRPPLSMPMFAPGSHRQRLPLPPPPPLRSGGASRSNGMPPMFAGGPRSRSMAPIAMPIGPRGSGLPRGPPMQSWPRRMPHMMPPMRPRFAGNGNIMKEKATNIKRSPKKMEEIESKKPWMTDDIRNEVQKKNKLYTKAKKSKISADWEEFKEMRNKVTKMIREAKSEYVAKHPEQAHLYPLDEEPYDQRDENYVSSDEETYCCEICDRDFSTKDAFSEHNSTHITCGIDGCTFSAYPLLVDKHINMQHLTGLYQRMKNLSTPEDVEKWIMERKKKYPTQTNINLRKAEELEKRGRGEVIEQRSNVRMKSKMAHKRERKRRKSFAYAARDTKKVDCTLTNKMYRGVRPFAGISVLDEESDEKCSDEKAIQTNLSEKITGYISDEDDIPQASVAPKQCDKDDIPQASVAPKQCDDNLHTISLSVSALVADYGGSDSNDEGPEEVAIKKVKMEDPQDDKKIENKVPETIPSKNREESSEKDDKSNTRPRDTAAKYNKQKRGTNEVVINYRNEKFLHRYRNKLLEKLLARDIQHERNIICQCMKYIIENNFFDSN